MPPVRDLLDLKVPCDELAPGLVRSALVEVYDGEWPLDDGLLVASELVTNAVQHSGCAAFHTLKVTAGHHDGNLMISVQDPGLSGGAAQPVTGEHRGIGGWGLDLVQRLSVRWGAERSGGYRVWAEIGPYRSAAG